MKTKMRILAVCLGAMAACPIYASGYGIAGEHRTPQGAAIDRLLSSPSAGNPSSRSDLIPANTMPPMQNGSYGNESSNGYSNNNNNGSPDLIPANPNVSVGNAASMGDTSTSQQAFLQTVRNMMPLTPDQIRALRYLFDKSQQAAAEYPGTPPRPTSSTVMVDLSPGASPPVVRLRAGYVTSLDFLDSTGQPWPIVAYDVGNPGAFNIAPNQPDGKSNTILVEAMDQYKSGNLAVMLKGESTPIMITLLPGQRAVDYRVDLRLPGLGPNAKTQFDGLPNTENAQLINFLDGVPPQSAVALMVEGGPCQAWLYGKKLYVRTQLTIISPSWTATMSSPDGTHVYEMMKTPVVLASQHGQIVQLTMKGL
jgi:intracellular multiplication protein IcmK